MSAATRIRWRGVIDSRGGAAALIPQTGDVVLVSRGGCHRWLVFRCPSGCGTELPINLDPRAGPAWRLYSPGPNASLYPSVWRDSDCEAHFILSRGKLWVFTDDYGLSEPEEVDESLVAAVRGRLSAESAHYFDIAEALGAEPWETLRSCRILVARRQAVEGRARNRGRFRKS